jgi:hypothetical protein
MKRLTIYLTVTAFILTFGIFVWGMSLKTLPTVVEARCAENSFTVENQAEVPAKLTIVEALCDGSIWKARLNLENTESKVIRSYEIENIESYEHKKDVWSSQGQNGINLEPGESKALNFSGGFPSGCSYDKPTGQIQTNVFRIKRIEFADGTSWENNKRSK